MEDLYYILVVLAFIAFIVFIVVNSIINKKVRETSNTLKEAEEVNKKYTFAPIIRRRHYIKYNVDSKRKCDKTSYESVIMYYITNNIDNIKSDVLNMKQDDELYQIYSKEYDDIKCDVKEDILQKVNMSKEKYLKREEKIKKSMKIKNNFETSIDVDIYYISPAGRNRWEKRAVYYKDALYRILQQMKDIEKYKQSVEYERSLMTESLRMKILRRDNYKCQICGCTAKDGVKLHIDHIKPVSKGGKTVESNLRVLCDRCNIGRSNKYDD